MSLLRCPATRSRRCSGPRQSARAVIPTIIAQLANGKKSIELGDVRPTRDFNYVLDTCRGFMALANSENTIGKTVNIGSNYEISIEKTFNLIQSIMKTDAKIIQDNQRIRPENSEVHRLWCDNKLINELTGYKPETNIETGLKHTVDWFLNPNNLKQYKADIYNV